jgi:hypothetical protein
MDAASLATIRHMRALTRLEVAQLRQERDLIPALQVVVSESCRERIRAEQAYKAHQAQHRAAGAAGTG